MFFSIVIPVYNVEKYLNQCVDSILSQTFKDFELILVDDGSKDNSGQICDGYAQMDARVKVIHKENGGLSDARNEGTSQASGKYIIYVDSDDYIDGDDFLEEVYSKAQNGADVICYKFRKYYDNAGKFGECSFSFPDFESYNTLPERVRYLVCRDSFYCSAWSKAIKLELIKDNEILFEKGLLGEDQEWYYHVLIKAKSIDAIDRAFVIYRQRENSITKTFKIKNLTDCLYIIKKWNTQIGIAEIEEEYKTALYHSLAKLYCNILIAYTNLKDKNKKKYYKELKELKLLLKYNLNPRTRVVSKIKRLCGFGLMMTALKILCVVRRK